MLKIRAVLALVLLLAAFAVASPSQAALTPSGSITATGGTEGRPQVIQNLRLTGTIKVTGPYVIIRNVEIVANARYAIHILPEANIGSQRTLIEDVKIVGGMAEGRCNYAIVFGEYVARRVNISRCGNGFWAGSNSTIERSHIHGMRDLPTDHSDGIQSTGGSNIRIVGNTITMDRAMTSAILLHAHALTNGGGGPLRNVLIEGNRLAGGGYTLNVKERGHPVSGLTVRGNTWVKGSWAFGPQQAVALLRQHTWTGNVFSDGTPNRI